MSSLVHDLRYAARALAASPGFTAVAVAVLALGIGANAAVFSVVDAVLLRPPAGVAEPERLVTVYTSDFSGPAFGASSWPDYVDFRDANPALSGLAAHTPTPVSATIRGETRRAFAEVVSGNWFDVLGTRPALGRALTSADDRPGSPPAVVLSHTFWSTQLGGDPAAVGRALVVNGRPFTVVGVAPVGFTGVLRGLRPDLWVPASTAPVVAPGSEWLDERGNRTWFLVGRLAPNASVEAAAARFQTLARDLHRAHPDVWTDLQQRPRRATVLPEAEARVYPAVRGPVRGFLAVLLGVVAIVLLVSCANLAGLLLGRAAMRRREVAVRLSLGAPRGRVVRQLLTESLLLAGLGAAAGFLVALWAADAVSALRPPVPAPLALEITLDGRVLAFTCVVATLAGVLFGLAPALQASQPDLLRALKGESARGGRGPRLRGALLAGQIALSLVLLIGAGLLLRTLHETRAIDPGYDVDDVLLLSLEPQLVGYAEGESGALYDRILERVRALPGVRDASVASVVPLGFGTSRRSVGVEGYEPAEGEDMELHLNVVGTRYFETMGIPLVRGRGFEESDRAGAPEVVVVNEALARRYWPGEDPLGKRLLLDGEGAPAAVIGVASNTSHVALGEEARPLWYRPVAQDPVSNLALHVRAGGDLEGAAAAVRREIGAIDPRLPVFDVRPLAANLDTALLPRRVAAALLGGFGALALLLAAVGLYGIVSQAVSRRTREVGVRMALGARGGDVIRLVLREGGAAVAAGLALGWLGAAATSRLLGGLLYGVAPLDPLVFVAVPLLLAAVALLGSWVPARQAARMDPVAALRHE